MTIREDIATAEERQGLPTGLLLAVLEHESGLNPAARSVNQGGSAPGSIDRGIAQINDYWHPDVSDEQAYDPSFAIPWAAQFLSQLYQRCGTWKGALSSYNTGSCEVVNEYPNLIISRLGYDPDVAEPPAVTTTAPASPGQPGPAPAARSETDGQNEGRAGMIDPLNIINRLFGTDLAGLDLIFMFIAVIFIIIGIAGLFL